MGDYKRIIVSGLAGAGKSTLVYRLADVYGWPLYSIGDTWRAMWKEKYPDASISFEAYIEGITRQDDLEMNVRMRENFSKEKIIGDTRYAVCYTVKDALNYETVIRPSVIPHLMRDPVNRTILP